MTFHPSWEPSLTDKVRDGFFNTVITLRRHIGVLVTE